MNPSDFVHLHLHSEYSLLDGAIRNAALVARVKELGMKAVALTDHGTMFGVLDFHRRCKEGGIQPIIGCEVYITPKSRRDRGAGAQKDTHHLLLLASSHEGYLNLGRLSSIGHTEGFYYKPRIDFETLEKHKEGLVATSSCLAGLIPQAIMDGNPRRAVEFTGKFVDLFGRDRFYIELMDHGIAEQREVNRAIVDIARKESLRLIATNDCHYLRKEDAELHEVLLCIQTGTNMSDPKRMKFDSSEFYLKSPEEMAKIFAELPEAVTNTRAVAEQCAFEFPKKQYHLPKFACPDGLGEFEYMKRLVEAGAAARYATPLSDAVRKRVDFELSTIERMGFAAYFLIVADFIQHARSRNIPVGPGRGSAAGSVIAYCLGITQLDPLEHGLLFERFLNPDRVSMPDIDVDFCFERRAEVLQYVREKYGADCVGQIVTFGTMKAKAAIRDIGRALEVPLADTDKIAKMVPDVLNITIEEALEQSEELRGARQGDPRIEKVLGIAQQVEGMVRHASIHASGIVIADRPLTDYCPLYRSPKDELAATQFTMTEIEESCGLLKMDLLGIKNLTVIRRVEDWLRERDNVVIEWERIHFEDAATYAGLHKGQTLGVFQLESDGMTGLVKNLKPSSFSDLTALIAIYRPGPLQAGVQTMYCNRKHGREQIVFDHPKLEPILGETYGLILYQEQVMLISQRLCGFTPGEADVLRKAMGKKKADVMAKMEAQFVAGAGNTSGVEESLARHIWTQIVTFAGYGFNKSHSAAYAVLTFQTAYLRAHYPVYFMAALLTNEIGGSTDGIAKYVGASREAGLELLPPDINASDAHFRAEGRRIRYALAAVKGVGTAFVDAVVKERAAAGPFKTIVDFAKRVPREAMNSRVIEALVKVGAFDSLHRNRAALMIVLPEVLQGAAAFQEERAGGQASFFDSGDESAPVVEFDELRIPEVRPWDDAQRAAFEREFLGFYLVDHPLNRYRVELESFGDFSSRGLADVAGSLGPSDQRNAAMCGQLANLTVRTDKAGNAWAIGVLEDLDGQFEVKFFARTFDRVRDVLQVGRLLHITGRLSVWNGRASFDAQAVTPVEGMRRGARAVRLEWAVESLGRDALFQLRETCRRFPGPRPVELALRHSADLVVEFGSTLKVDPSEDAVRAFVALPGKPRVRLVSAKANGERGRLAGAEPS